MYKMLRCFPMLSLVCWFVTGITGSAISQDSSLTALRPLLRENTMAVAVVDSAKLTGFPDSLPAASKRRLGSLLDSLAGETAYLLFDLSGGPGLSSFRLAVKQGGKFNLEKLTSASKRLQLQADKPQAGFIVFDAAVSDRELRDTTPSTFTPMSDESFAQLEKALLSVNKHGIRLASAIPRHVRRTYQELMPQLPKSWGGGSTQVFLDGVIWASVGIDAKEYQCVCNVQSASTTAAQEFIKTSSALVPQILQSNSQIAAMVPKMNLSTDGSMIRLVANGKDTMSGPLQVATESLLQMVSPEGLASKQKNLREITLAMLNFESANRVLPPNEKQRNADGKPRLSWRVHILPFMKPYRELYNEFHLDEPWDSPHNLKLLPRMPNVYRTADFEDEEKPKVGHTCFLAPSGPGSILASSTVVRFQNIGDGTSNTIVVVEVKPEYSRPWTAPEDYDYDPNNPASGLAAASADGASAVVGYCDGSVRMAKLKQAVKNWLFEFQCNDGNISQLE